MWLSNNISTSYTNLLHLCKDVIFVNGNVCMVASSRKLKFVTSENILNITSGYIGKILNKVIKLYRRVGFIVLVILMDMGIDKLL